MPSDTHYLDELCSNCGHNYGQHSNANTGPCKSGYDGQTGTWDCECPHFNASVCKYPEKPTAEMIYESLRRQC